MEVTETAQNSRACLGRLPNEMLKHIFDQVDDLDEATRLSHVCRSLRAVYHLQKDSITKNIIVCHTNLLL